MNLLFANGALWPWLAALAVPLLLHLYARVRPRAYPFPSADFLHRVLRRTTRMKRPRDRVLLLLRTLLFAAVLLAFLKPVLSLSAREAAPGAARNVVAIVDATASMAWVEGGRTRFAIACAEATEALGGLTARDSANVIWLRARPTPVFPELGRNLPFLRQELRRGQVSYEAGDIPAALRMAVDMLAGTEGRREIHLLSDFQRSAWDGIVLPDTDGIEWVRIPVARELAANTAIVRTRIDPPQPLPGEPFTLAVELRHYADTPRRVNAFLSLDEIQRSRDVLIPAWGEVTLTFHERLAQPGDVPFEVRLDHDAFPGDDRHFGIVSVRDALRVGVFAGDRAVAQAWQRVLQAVGWARTIPVRHADLATDVEADVLLLAGWDGDGDGVRDFMRRGGAVVWFPARDTPLSALFPEHPRVTEADLLTRESRPRQPWGLRLAADDDPLFRVFEGGAYGDPARARFAARFRLPEGIARHETVLLAYDDAMPALTRRRMPDEGARYLWNLSLAPDETAWTGHEEFVALVAEMVLAERPGADRFPAWMPGDSLLWMPDSDVAAEDVHVDGPHGDSRGASAVSRNGQRLLSAGYADRPGLYRWQARDRTVFQGVVNFPAMESDLRTLSPAELRAGQGTTVSRGHTARRLRDGIQLWPYLAMAAVLLALTEGWTAWRFGVKS